MRPLVRAEGVRKVYRIGSTVEALAGVDAQIHAGELLAVVGPSVSGKTTLLNCLSGLEPVDEGHVQIEGTDLCAPGYRRRQILSGLMAENLALATFGDVMGLATGLAMGQLMLRTFLEEGASLPFVIDLPQLAGVVLLVFAARAAVTVASAARAAALPPALAARHLD